MLNLLADLPWAEIAGAAESDEVKTAQSLLDSILAEIDKISRRIAVTNSAMEDPEIEVAALKVLASRAAQAESALATLGDRKTTLETTLGAARSRSEALYSPENLISLIREAKPESNELRLRLRTEIRKRITRIELRFGAEVLTGDGLSPELKNALAGEQVVARLIFANGADRWASLAKNRAVLLF